MGSYFVLVFSYSFFHATRRCINKQPYLLSVGAVLGLAEVLPVSRSILFVRTKGHEARTEKYATASMQILDCSNMQGAIQTHTVSNDTLLTCYIQY